MTLQQLIKGLESDLDREVKADMLAYIQHGITSGELDGPEWGDALKALYPTIKDVWLSGEILRLINRSRIRRILGRDLLRMTAPPPGDRELKRMWDAIQALKRTYDAANEAGESFDQRFDLREEIGRGGMSVVLHAIRLSDGLDVAIKYLKSELSASASMQARFSRECQLTRSFAHPNIIRVFETGSHDGGAYMVMEYLPAGGMDTMAGHPEFCPQVAIAAMRQTARAAAYLHRQQVIHRDIKLSNILASRWEPNRSVSPDQWVTVKLCDFGLGKRIPGDGLTRVGTRMGTEFYTAPEMRESPETADHRADIYSLGVAIYRLLSRTGYPEGAYPSLHQLNPSLPVEIDRLVDACVQVERANRLDNADSLADSLDEIAKQIQADHSARNT